MSQVQAAQLLAQGVQDAWLSGEPQISFYRSRFKRHAPFALTIERFVVPKDGKIVLNPKSDLLGYTYLTAHDPTTGALVPNADWSNIVSTVELVIGNQTIATHDLTYINTIQRVLEADTYSKRSSATAFQPLGFFFDRQALPLVALKYSDVRINITWASTAAVSQYLYRCWSHCIHLGEDERQFFATQRHQMLIPQMQRVPISTQPFFHGPLKYLAAPCVNYSSTYSVLWVAVSISSNVGAYSFNGKNWYGFSLPSVATSWQSVAVNSKGRFVAIAVNTNVAAYSDDGQNWTPTVLPVSGTWFTLACNKNTDRFVACIRSSKIGAYSDDGINWIQTTTNSSSFWYSGTCRSKTGRFVCVSSQLGAVQYSDDGITWGSATLPVALPYQTVRCSPTTGRFVTVPNGSATVCYSDDGISWIQVPSALPSASNWGSLTCSPTGRFFTSIFNGSFGAYSDDGISWTRVSMPVSSQWQAVDCGINGVFVAVSQGNTTDAAYSTDNAVTWKLTKLPTSTSWRAVTSRLAFV